MRLKASWRRFTPEQVKEFLRSGVEGPEHPSRAKAVSSLKGMTSVLDVGCATGVMFELIHARWPGIDYLGIDSTEQFVREARERFPTHADRFQTLSLYDVERLGRTFDAVLCRHVLEHLPDYVPAVQRLYSAARKKLILVFYLPPRPLRFGRKRHERFQRGFYTHTYDLGSFVDHLLNGLAPFPYELRVHPRQGKSDPRTRWADRENIIYEVFREAPAAEGVR